MEEVKITVTPAPKHVICKPVKNKQTSTVLHVPEEAQNTKFRGEVIKIGSKVEMDELKVGVEILHIDKNPPIIPLPNDEYMIVIDERAIVAIIEKVEE